MELQDICASGRMHEMAMLTPMERPKEFNELLRELCDPYRTPADYIIDGIEARPGKSLRLLHLEMEKAECYIVNAKRGERGLLMCKLSYDPYRYHRLHTSIVQDVIESVDGRSLIIMTQNTNYILKRINFAGTFRGVQKLGDDLSYVLS